MDKLSLALVLSKVIEFGVTEYSISNGVIEGNPLIRDRPTRIIMNSAFIIGSPFIYREIKRKNPKLAKATAVVLILGNGYLVYRNLRLMRKP